MSGVEKLTAEPIQRWALTASHNIYGVHRIIEDPDDAGDWVKFYDVRSALSTLQDERDIKDGLLTEEFRESARRADKILALTRERDAALTRIEKLEKENEALRAAPNLIEALSPFAYLASFFLPENGWATTDKLTISFDDAPIAEIDISCFLAARDAVTPVVFPQEDPPSGGDHG